MNFRRFLPLALLALALPAAAYRPLEDRLDQDQKRAFNRMGADVNIVLDEQRVPSMVSGKISLRAFRNPEAAAQTVLDEFGAAFRRGADDGFLFRNEQHDELGQTHVRMTQAYRGIPVLHGELIVHMTEDSIIGINGHFKPNLDVDTHASLSEAQLMDYAIAAVLRDGGTAPATLAVEPPMIVEGRYAIPVKVEFETEQGFGMDDIYVDAQTGHILDRLPRVFTAKNRKIYTLNQACISTGNEIPGTLVFQEGGTSTDTAAMGAYNGTGKTYDYYKTIFNRDSYDNAGAAIVSSVHGQFSTGSSCTKNNAAWFDSPYNQMAFGDGDGSSFANLATSLDVTAHELSHAVTSRTCNLAYRNESGALNEAASDIMGRSVAFWSGQGSPATKTDWGIGADVYTPSTSGDALRYMYDPAKDGYSADYYPTRNYASGCTPSSSNDQCGVHTNSGIGNLFYYLLSQGGTHPRSKTTVAVTGVGLTKAQAIWYRGWTVYMTSSTTFQGARTATAQAAADLYGGTCTPEWTAVQKAWDAVGVPGTWSCGGTSTFPESAHPYTNSYDNTWTYTVTGSPASINVTFDSSTATESGYDYIYITDKNGNNITGSPFSGTTLASATKTVTGDTVKIRLKTDSSVTAYGFKVTNIVAGGSTGDTTAPTVSITAPTAGSTLTGATTVTASATDNVGVTKVEFYLDGTLQTTDTSSPYSWAWTPTSAQNGTRSLTAKAYDAAGNTKTSTAVSVTVNISSGCTAQQLFGNAGFESGATTWTATSGVITSSTSRPARTGSWKAWLLGNGSTASEYLYQSVTIPSCATTATLSFWIRIDTAETTTSSAYDTLKVQVRNSSGTVLATLATYSNLNKNTTYTQKSFNLASYKGQTVQIYFLGAEDSSLQTSFVIDDTALNVN